MNAIVGLEDLAQRHAPSAIRSGNILGKVSTCQNEA